MHPAWWTFPYPFHQIEETIVTLEGMGEKKKQRKFVLASETTATRFKISRMSGTPLVLLRRVRIVACIKTRTREESLRFFLLRNGLPASENFIVLSYLSAAYFSYKKRKKKKQYIDTKNINRIKSDLPVFFLGQTELMNRVCYNICTSPMPYTFFTGHIPLTFGSQFA